MKKFAVFTTILFLGACAEPEPEVLLVDKLDADNMALAKEICTAIGQTPKYDSSARREIFKDYGIPLGVIAEMEGDVLLGDNYWCAVSLVNAQRCVDRPESPSCNM